MDKAIKGKLLEQFSKAGYDIEQTTQGDVRLNYHITCDHNRPPLLAMMDERTAEGRMAISSGEGIESGMAIPLPLEEVLGEGVPISPNFKEIGGDTEGAADLEEEHSFEDDEETEEADESEDDGVDEADVNDLAGDISPEFEQADEAISQEEF